MANKDPLVDQDDISLDTDNEPLLLDTTAGTDTMPSCAMESFLAKSIGDLRFGNLQHDDYFGTRDDQEARVGFDRPSQIAGRCDDVLRLAEIPSDESSQEGSRSCDDESNEEEEEIEEDEDIEISFGSTSQDTLRDDFLSSPRGGRNTERRCWAWTEENAHPARRRHQRRCRHRRCRRHR